MSTSKLPPRKDNVVKAAHENPVWTLSSTGATAGGAHPSPTAQPPLTSMCDVHARPDAVCCRTLKGDDERSLIDPDIVKDIIIGLSDGLTVPFGLTAGLAAIGNAKLVVIGGISELISGSISMGVGGFLSAQAEQDHYRYLLRTTRQRVKRSCAGEIEREVTDVLSSVGLDEPTCRRVAHGLMKVETEIVEEIEETSPYKPKRISYFQTILRSIARKPKSLLNGDSEGYGTFDNGNGKSKSGRSPEEYGLTAFLIKFAEGQEEVPNSRLLISAFTIGFSYAVGGIIPLIPYFFTNDIMLALYISIAITGITLVLFGIAKAYYTGSKIGWKGYTKSAVSTLAIGGLAAGSAYGISKALEGSM